MKTLICETPKQLTYKTSPIPERTAGNTLLRVKRVGVCGTDLHAFEGTQPFFSYPRILGHELATEIFETDSTQLSTGEQVTIIPYFSCGKCVACSNGKPNCCESIQVFGVHIDGGLSEFISVPTDSVLKGEGLSLEELALVEPLAIGVHGVRRADIKTGEYVLVIGSGPIGLGIIEFARIAGARVIVMDLNEKRLTFCRTNLQVEHTINPSTDDVLQRLKQITNNAMPTVIIDATGSAKAINSAFQYMAHGGRYVLVGLQKENILVNHPEFHKREATLMSSRNATRDDFEWVIACMQKKLLEPLQFVTHSVHFDEASNCFENWLSPDTAVIKAMIVL